MYIRKNGNISKLVEDDYCSLVIAMAVNVMDFPLPCIWRYIGTISLTFSTLLKYDQ